MPCNPKLKTVAFGILCATSLSSLALPVRAADPAEVPHRVVKMADLDLARSAGVAALYARIKFAARQICEPVIARDLASEMRSRACVAQAVERAIGEVNLPQLTSYHLAKSGASPAITLAQGNR